MSLESSYKENENQSIKKLTNESMDSTYHPYNNNLSQTNTDN
jgi:hypothetical protein